MLKKLMLMAKNPCFPFYAQDFLIDTMRWTRSMQGLHTCLLAESWINGGLVDDKNKPAGLDKKDIKTWNKIKEKWVLENGYWKNKKLETVREQKIKYNTHQRNNALKRWNKPVTTISTSCQQDAIAIPKLCDGIAENMPIVAMPLENEEEKENNKGVIGENKLLPLGIKVVSKMATEAWKDEQWKQNIIYGQGIDMKQLHRWMALFNASLCNDTMPNFNEKLYKKLFGGWLSLQKSKGRKLSNPEIERPDKPLEKLDI